MTSLWIDTDIAAAEARHGITEAIYDRLNEQTLTADDARKLMAFEYESPRPCPDFLAYLKSIIETESL